MTSSETTDAPTAPQDDASLDILLGVMKFAELQGLDPERLVKDLAGNSELAKLCRNLLGLPEKEAAKRGRPANTDQNWNFFILINLYRREMTLDDALKEYVARTGGDTPGDTRFSALKRQYSRLLDQWRDHARPMDSLTDLFRGPPKGS